MFLQLFLMEAVLGPLSSDQNYHLLYCLNIFKAVCTRVFLCQYFSLKKSLFPSWSVSEVFSKTYHTSLQPLFC